MDLLDPKGLKHSGASKGIRTMESRAELRSLHLLRTGWFLIFTSVCSAPSFFHDPWSGPTNQEQATPSHLYITAWFNPFRKLQSWSPDSKFLWQNISFVGLVMCSPLDSEAVEVKEQRHAWRFLLTIHFLLLRCYLREHFPTHPKCALCPWRSISWLCIIISWRLILSYLLSVFSSHSIREIFILFIAVIPGPKIVLGTQEALSRHRLSQDTDGQT